MPTTPLPHIFFNHLKMPSRQLLSTLLASLGKTRWSLTRTLRSENPLDLNGELQGTATFTAQSADREWLYCEEGDLPTNVGTPMQTGLRWTKKYIWRLGEDSERMSVWFVKVNSGPEEAEADYLFHDFDFDVDTLVPEEKSAAQRNPGEFVAPPVPPAVLAMDLGNQTTVLNARGNHLCINDMYRTAYAFRIEPGTGEVLSWASRHVVKGPKKEQEIINQYEKI